MNLAITARTIAFAGRPREEPRFLHDTFPADTARREVMCQLVPGADVRLLTKAKMAHNRSLAITLKDGRQLTIHLDQGFGGWRVDGVHRHDFSASEAAQARAISVAVFGVSGDKMAGAPIAISKT